ncbi:hypothetical protein GCM10029992_26410 [Glycomyces albus]
MTDDHSTDPGRNAAAPVVLVRSVQVAFGGLLALRGIDLDAAQGERLAILGPNGAGKTTLFNVIAGDIGPTGGSVAIKGVDCTRLPSRRRPRLGVARTYQKARTFEGLSVADNIYLALAGHRRRHRVPWRTAADRALRAEAERVAESVWLGDHIETDAGSSPTARSASSNSAWRSPPNRTCSCSTSRPPVSPEANASTWSNCWKRCPRRSRCF